MNFEKTMLVGLKALGGGIIAYIIMMIFFTFTMFLTGLGYAEIIQNRPMLLYFMMIIALLFNLYIVGYVYNLLWKWK
jgi:hypothetical protein